MAQGQQAMSRDVGYLVEVALEPSGALQRIGAERIGRFEHQKRLLALGKDTLEIERGLRHGVAGDDQTLDCRIGRDPRGAVHTGHGEERKMVTIQPRAFSTRRKNRTGSGEISIDYE